MIGGFDCMEVGVGRVAAAWYVLCILVGFSRGYEFGRRMKVVYKLKVSDGDSRDGM